MFAVKASSGPLIARANITLRIALPGIERGAAEALVAEAHEVCPYSNAVRGNIDVALELI